MDNKILKVDKDQFTNKIYTKIKNDNSLCVDISSTPEYDPCNPDQCGIMCINLYNTSGNLPEFISFGSYNQPQNLSRIAKIQDGDTIKNFLSECWSDFINNIGNGEVEYAYILMQ